MPVDFRLQWVPANVLSKVESPTSLQNTSYIGPIELIDDPDSFDCTGYNMDARLSAPKYHVKTPTAPFSLDRQNAALITRGNIQPGDTASSSSIYDQARLARATVTAFVTTNTLNDVVLPEAFGYFVAEWTVNFYGQKFNGVTSLASFPSSLLEAVLSDRNRVEEDVEKQLRPRGAEQDLFSADRITQASEARQLPCPVQPT